MSRFIVLILIVVVTIGCNDKETIQTKSEKIIIHDQVGSPSQNESIEETLSIDQLKTPEQVIKYRNLNSLEKLDISGELFVEVVENLQLKTHSRRIFIRSAGKKYLVNALAQDFDIEDNAGEVVTLTGFRKENRNFGYLKAVTHKFKGGASEVKPRTENMLVVLVKFNDGTGPFPKPGKPMLKAKTLAPYLNTKFFNTYINDISSKRIKNTVTKVVGWYTIDRNCEDMHFPGRPHNKCYMSKEELRDIVVAKGIDHTKFDNISVIVESELFYKWGYASLSKSLIFPDGHRVSYAFSMIGNRRLYYGTQEDHTPYFAPTSFMGIFLHERLHTLGVSHSKGLDCGSNKFLHNCKYVEYGNPYDTMGAGKYVTALNADQLKKEGLRDNYRYLNITQNGEYELSPLLSQKTNSVIGAYIKSEFSSSPVFMLENRTAMSVDQELSKVSYSKVNYGLSLYTSMNSSSKNSSPSWGSKLRFTDAKPRDDSDLEYYDRVAYDGISFKEPFFDPITGVTVKILSPFSVQKGKEHRTRFSVTFDEEKRVCYKESVAEQLGAPYIQKTNISSNQSKLVGKSNVVLRAGDKFVIKIRSFRKNPLYCPRETLQVLGSIPIFGSWVDTKPGDSYEGEENKPYVINQPVKDITKVNELSREISVPQGEDLPVGDHSFNITLKNRRTGEEVVRELSFRVE